MVLNRNISRLMFLAFVIIFSAILISAGINWFYSQLIHMSVKPDYRLTPEIMQRYTCSTVIDPAAFSLTIDGRSETGTVLHVHATSYNVTKFTGALYLAEETEPKTPDSSGALEFDTATGKLVVTNKISYESVKVVAQLCSKQITEEACLESMKLIKGGNPFSCFADEFDCRRARNNSNVLAVHASTCKVVQ